MSLINQMLKDLEQRRPQDVGATGEPSLQGVAPVAGAVGPRRCGWALALVLTPVVLLVVGVGLWWWQDDGARLPSFRAPSQKQPAAAGGLRQTKAADSAPQAASLAPAIAVEEPQVAVAERSFSEQPNRDVMLPKTAVVVPGSLQPEAPPPSVESGGQSAPVAAQPAILQTLRINEQQDYLRLVVYFDRIPVHHLSRESGERRLTLALGHTRLAGNLPAPSQSGLLEGIEVSQESGDLILTLNFRSEFHYLETVENAETDFRKRLVIDLYPKSQSLSRQVPVKAVEQKNTISEPVVPRPKTPPVMQGQVAKVPVGDSPHREAERAFQGASAALGRDDWPAAESLLRQVLRLDPGHLRAREVLVGRFLQVGRLSEAFALLAEGVRMKPEYLGFRKPYARLLVDQGDLGEALQVLLRGGLPEVSVDPEAHALLAAIYQQLGEYSLASRSYRQLVGVRPGAGLWWMGMGIAQEGEGQGGKALQAYRRALACADLRADLKAYVNQRCRELEARVQQ